MATSPAFDQRDLTAFHDRANDAVAGKLLQFFGCMQIEIDLAAEHVLKSLHDDAYFD
ncbi:hypothetical protein [Rhizobium sp. BR 315]|uniref:hypothetical protein n=1 Tax=Rhizobium sp. BR 315 TaxID=3040014 RepID=UPI003D34F8C5